MIVTEAINRIDIIVQNMRSHNQRIYSSFKHELSKSLRQNNFNLDQDSKY